MGRFADDLYRAVEHLPVLAWLSWITFNSLTTTVVGLVLIGIGVFGKFNDAGGVLKLPEGIEASGSIRFILVAGGLAIYIGGGALRADPPPQNSLSTDYQLGTPL